MQQCCQKESNYCWEDRFQSADWLRELASSQLWPSTILDVALLQPYQRDGRALNGSARSRSTGPRTDIARRGAVGRLRGSLTPDVLAGILIKARPSSSGGLQRCILWLDPLKTRWWFMPKFSDGLCRFKTRLYLMIYFQNFRHCRLTSLLQFLPIIGFASNETARTS